MDQKGAAAEGLHFIKSELVGLGFSEFRASGSLDFFKSSLSEASGFRENPTAKKGLLRLCGERPLENIQIWPDHLLRCYFSHYSQTKDQGTHDVPTPRPLECANVELLLRVAVHRPGTV